MELSDRQERILKVLVEDYIETGHPVGSASLMEHSGLNVSSATIRSELALMEDLGFVLQLHTSGGRVPTTGGYRYYIERLVATSTVPAEDQITIRHQFHQAHTELEDWLKLATAVMAHRAHNVALITSPKAEEVHFKHVELVEAQPHTVLTIVVMSDGVVMQELMAVDETITQEELRAFADSLNASLGGAPTLVELTRRSEMLPELLQPFAAIIIRLLDRAGARRLHVYHQGLGEMLSRPEYALGAHPNLAVGERLRRVVDFLQQGLAMEDLLSLMAMESGVQVVIGGESPLQELEDYALVLGRYGPPAEASGVLGVLGPARMDYARAISLVRYMTELMTDLVFGR